MKSILHNFTQLPFRGPVSVIDSSVNHGTLLLSSDKNVLVWNIGQKFPMKSTEISVSAVVQLGEPRHVTSLEDKFCVGQNAYAQVQTFQCIIIGQLMRLGYLSHTVKPV